MARRSIACTEVLRLGGHRCPNFRRRTGFARCGRGVVGIAAEARAARETCVARLTLMCEMRSSDLQSASRQVEVARNNLTLARRQVVRRRIRFTRASPITWRWSRRKMRLRLRTEVTLRVCMRSMRQKAAVPAHAAVPKRVLLQFLKYQVSGTRRLLRTASDGGRPQQEQPEQPNHPSGRWVNGSRPCRASTHSDCLSGWCCGGGDRRGRAVSGIISPYECHR